MEWSYKSANISEMAETTDMSYADVYCGGAAVSELFSYRITRKCVESLLLE